MNRMQRHHWLASRRGHAAVEFALILPLLVTIIFACIDLGRFAHTYIAVTNAARAGAGFGSSNFVDDLDPGCIRSSRPFAARCLTRRLGAGQNREGSGLQGRCLSSMIYLDVLLL